MRSKEHHEVEERVGFYWSTKMIAHAGVASAENVRHLFKKADVKVNGES